ncbi:MAG: histone deacetylase [Acidobacteriota bacterium]|nr:histone deacetylase [Acidobacteriota bacterium]
MALSRWLHPLLRSCRLLRRHLWPVPVDVVYSEKYQLSHSTAPHDPQRSEHILTFLLAEGLVLPKRLHRPRIASVRNLRRVHTDNYLESLRDTAVLQKITGMTASQADLDSYVDIQRYMVGGTHQAVKLALEQHNTVIHLGGGLHHAHADRGRGFCILNDVAVAVRDARAGGFAGRVLIIDLDLHHGDGTEAIFAKDETVHTFSIHNRSWQDIPAVASTNIELGSDVDDDTYLRALRRHLPPLLEELRPRLVIYLAGVDPAATDALGDWRITTQGMLARDRFVAQQIHRLRQGATPWVITLAGGYGTRAWRYSGRFFSSLLNGGRALEPPSTDEITLERYRRLSSLLQPEELTGIPSTGSSGGDDWQLTPEDIYGALGDRRESRFLSYYSKHGIELVLERSGLLDRLRSLGFRHLTVDWDLDNAAGQTIRVLCIDRGQELLGELRAQRERRLIPGMELLQVEWLLLQNPRATFEDGRPPLPGQEHPGLGMLRDVVAMLLVMCERLGLDGLSFVPSHYHLAATSHKVLRFLEPEHERLYRGLHKALAELSVAEASRAVDEERIVDAETGEPFRWRPMPMVLPVSDRLKEELANRWQKMDEEEPSATPRFILRR